MSQKRIPGRRSSADRQPAAVRSHKPKRVRAGAASSKARKQAKAVAQGTAPRTSVAARAIAASRTRAAALGAPDGSPQPPPELSEKQRRHLRGLAHELKPIVRLGNAGLTEAVATETARALHDHELVKVKAPGGDREARDALFSELAQRTSSTLVHRIGNVAVLYRPNPAMPRILIPDSTA